MGKKRDEDWFDDELLPRIKSRATFGATFFWLAIWAITGFNFWAGIGFFFAWGGTVGLFSKNRRRGDYDNDDYDDDDDYEDNRGYRRASGFENEEQALARRNEPEALEPAPKTALHRQVTQSAAPNRARLEAAASVADGALGVRLRNMVAMVKDVENGLEAEPSRLSDVQRLFTYYIPATADLLAARGAIVGSNDGARLAEIDTMIGKLDLAFTDFAQRLKGHDAANLDLDLRLLDQALDDEFVMKTKA
jgi:hypothetical protein